LLNRRAVEEHLQYELRRLERFPAPLSVMLIDLDGFKQVNDRYGHLAGDAVLRGVAAELRNHLRDSDITGRWGGDEFLVLLPGTDEPTAKKVLDRLQQRVAELVGPGGETPRFSAGVATAYGPTSADALIAKADAQLYTEKKTVRHA
ncbi:MAG: GGDEF domain-containing protein, partial [Candidatus Dadabacteria bacterium]